MVCFIVPAVQHERGPRNATLRRQMALYFTKDPEIVIPQSSAALNLVLPKPEPRITVAAPTPHHAVPHPIYTNVTINKVNFARYHLKTRNVSIGLLVLIYLLFILTNKDAYNYATISK